MAALLVLVVAAGMIVTGCKIDPEDNAEEKIVEPPVDTDEFKSANKYEFRATWVSTISNLDINRQSSETMFKKAYNNILDTCQSLNMNAVIFQVRPLLDAFYPSEINPWSQFLYSNKQGQGPAWDPLEIMLEETHKRGMEYHAWFNPYRVTQSAYETLLQNKSQSTLDGMTNAQVIALLRDAEILAANNFAVLHPEYVYRYERKFYLDAGIPAVRQHIIDTIKEVIENYDVDAIHFDDYFYPYNATDAMMSAVEVNTAYYAGYPGNREAREQWRRDNNTALINGVKAAIAAENQTKNKAIQFGVSPFGIWYRNTLDPRGSNTGATAFTYTDGVYADTYKWIKDESIDYMCPQIYWEQTHASAPYDVLASWWADVVEGLDVALYIGHANYKHIQTASVAAWQNPEEIINQLKFNQNDQRIKGSSFFSYKDVNRTSGTGTGIPVLIESNKLIKAYWEYPTLVPPKPWLKSTPPAAPLNVTRQGNKIIWADTTSNESRYYVIYRITTATEGSDDASRVVQDGSKIIARVWRDGQTNSYTDKDVEYPAQYTYIVTALNAAHVESAPSVAVKE
jgi:uncharacterized lipoprotein YddW (UPF0748 family)